MEKISIKPSKQFLEIIRQLDRSSSDSSKNIQALINDTDGDGVKVLTTEDVRWCHTKMKEGDYPIRIHQLIEDSQIILPESEPQLERNPELEKRVQMLKLKQQELEYQSMVKNLDTRNFTEFMGVTEVRREFREMNKQLITGMQYLLSIIGTFFGVFFGISLVLVDYGPRVMLSTFAAVAVAIAEIYFIIRDDLRAEQKEEDNKKSIENKVNFNPTSKLKLN